MPKAMHAAVASTPPITRDAGREIAPPPTSRRPAAHAPSTTPATTAANGRYMRCSTAACPSGRMLDVMARMAKNHAPRNPQASRFASAQRIANSKPTSGIAGSSTFAAVRAIGHS